MPTRAMPVIRRVLAASLFAGQAALFALGAMLHSPALDEPAHLAAGVSNWQLGSFELYKVNPPLLRMVAAMPVVLAGVESDYSGYRRGPGVRAEFEVMDDFARVNGPRIFWLITLSRWALLPLALAGGWVCYLWARDLYGETSALLALALWIFCPNILAYSQTITADVGAAALGAAAHYAFWKWCRNPSWRRALAAGLLLGVAELSKTIWVLLFGLWPILWVICGTRAMSALDASRGRFVGAIQLATILVLGLVGINLGYGFEGSGTRMREYLFVSAPLKGQARDLHAAVFGNRFAKGALASAPIPLPKNYVEGIDQQWHDIEIGKPSYWRGRWKDRGWWFWYAYALAVKVPLGSWGLFVLALAVRIMHRGGYAHGTEDVGSAHFVRTKTTWRDELILIAPAVAVLVLVSSQTGFSRYLRYVLPLFPYAFIWTSSVARSTEWKRWKLATATLALLAWSIGGSLWYAPHWMSYFNELAGGPLGGPRHLIDAQVDWGQDLLYLKKWLDAHPEARPLKFAYFGSIDPRLAGVEFAMPPKGTIGTTDRMELSGSPPALAPGWYAVSVNHLYGCPFYSHNGEGRREWVDRPYYSYFRRFEHVATAGYSIYIYHLTEAEISAAASAANRVTRRLDDGQ